jgi:hypothetical protein
VSETTSGGYLSSGAAHPFPVGARVRHYGRQWTDEAFATVLEAKPQRDGTFEYRVMVDEDSGWIRSESGETWWPSYYTRPGEPPYSAS